MNYYKQGDAAKADQIKAAFEKEGYGVTGFDMCNDNILFFTYELEGGAKVISTTNANLYTANIIKTHPDYKELKLPVEFKFKVGDWVVSPNGSQYLIAYIDKEDNRYLFEINEYTGEPMHYEDVQVVDGQYHLWKIAGAKDGDVLATDNGWTCIFKAFDGCTFTSYCFMDSQKWFCEFGSEAHTLDSRINGNILPATKEQRDLLFAKMKEAGYEWDEKKKELRKIKPHYENTNFKPFDKVLVRDDDNECWMPSLFGWFDSGLQDGKFVCGTSDWEQCIPFEGNEHLLGTTDMPSEEYINW